MNVAPECYQRAALKARRERLAVWTGIIAGLVIIAYSGRLVTRSYTKAVETWIVREGR